MLTDYQQETTTTIIILNIVSLISIVNATITLIVLIRHFRRTQLQYTSFKVFAIIPIVAWLLGCIAFTVFDTNLFLPRLHNNYNFIDNHCHTIQQTQIILFHIVKFGIWVFSSLRIRIFFQSTPYKLSDIVFYIQILTYIIFTSLSAYQFSIYGEEGIFYASNNHKYKFCWMFTDNIEMDGIWIVVFISNEWIINLALLYLLYSKTKKLEQYQRENKELSPYFSQRDNILQMVNTKTMKKCIFGGLTSMVVNMVGVSIYVTFHTNCLVGIGLIVTGLPVIMTFDISLDDVCCIGLCLNGGNNVAVGDDNVENVYGHEQGIEITRKQQEYLSRIMAAYHQVPRRYGMNPSHIQIEGH